MEGLGVKPDLVVGDFDSHEKPETDAEMIELPREKDDTDTFFAAKEMVRRGFEEFLLVGVIGARLDHTLGNLSILFMLDTAGKRAKATDDYAEIEVISAKADCPDWDYQYAVSNEVLPGETAEVSVMKGRVLLIKIF